jgi:hypothetical protein
MLDETRQAWHASGLLVAYHTGAPGPPPEEGEIGGIPWREVLARTRGFGGGGAAAAEQLFEHLIVVVWPLAKVGLAAGAAGFFGKAGAAAWDGLHRGLRATLGTLTHNATIRVAHDENPDHDWTYEVRATDAESVSAAVEAIAQDWDMSETPAAKQRGVLLWDGSSRSFRPALWDPGSGGWTWVEDGQALGPSVDSDQ